MTMKLIPVFIILISPLSCSDKNECSGVCTAQFVTIAVNIHDENGDHVVLDSFTVTLTDTNKDITEDLHFNPAHSDSYPIINDNFKAEAQSDNLKIQFIGIISDVIVVQENYVIGANCCHIELVSGETEITI